MSTLDSRQDALQAGKRLKSSNGLIVCGIEVLDASRLFPVTVFRADTRVVESCGNGMHVRGLAVTILQHVAVTAVQDALGAETERTGMIAGIRTASARFNSRQADALVVDERIEHAGRIRTTPDTGHNLVGQAANRLLALLSRFAADDRLKITDHHRKRMGPHDGAENVVCRLNRGHPITHGLVDRVAQSARSARDGPHLRPQRLHVEYVQPLPPDVFFAHVHDAVQSEPCTSGCRCHSVLARTRLGDDSFLAHAQCEQGLSDRVIDLVSAGVIQVLALQIDPGSTAFFRHTFSEVQRARPPRIRCQKRGQTPLKRVVALGTLVFFSQFFQGMHQRFGHITATEFTEPAHGIGDVCSGNCYVLHIIARRG